MKQLSLIEIAFFLKKVSLFEELDLDLLVAIADKMNQDIYDEKETVFEIHQKAIRMYFIAKGSVDLFDSNQQLIQNLKENNFFGDESLFNEKPRTYKAICSQDTLLLTLTKTNLLHIISECPFVALSLLNHYAKNTSCRWKNRSLQVI